MTKKIATLHPRNPHQGRYDLTALVKTYPALKAFITQNPSGEETVDFSDDKAVICLNRCVLGVTDGEFFDRYFYLQKTYQMCSKMCFMCF